MVSDRPTAVMVVLVTLGVALCVVPVRAQGTAVQWLALTKTYEQQVTRTPGDPLTRFTLAMLYARVGRILDGYKQLQEADRAVGGPVQRYEMARQIAAQTEAVVRTKPDDLLARYRLAFAWFFMGDHARSAKEFERIVVAEPKNDWGYVYLGLPYASMQQTDRAIVAWERGVTVNPNNAILHYLLGRAYAKNNDKKQAASHFAAAYRDLTLYEYVTGRHP